MVWLISMGLLLAMALSGCGPSYSPDIYATNAAQQANKVDPGVVVGVRKIGISAAGTIGAVTGAAAGGIAGSRVTTGPVTAFTALGGSLVGGLAGSAAEHVTADTPAFEYIIRKPNGDLVSVTQKDKTPLAIGQKVLVIAGTQARVVADYTVPLPVSVDKLETGPQTATAEPPTAAVKPASSDGDAKVTELRPASTQTVDGKPAEPKRADTFSQYELQPAAVARSDVKPFPATSASDDMKVVLPPAAAATP